MTEQGKQNFHKMPYVKEEKEQTIKAEQKDLKQISAFEGVQAFQKYVDKV